MVQLTDDEKFLFNEMTLTIEQSNGFAIENAKDIISFGFDPENTFIFSNINHMGLVTTAVACVLSFVYPVEPLKPLSHISLFLYFFFVFKSGEFYKNVVRISKSISCSAAKGTFGFNDR